MEKELRQIYRKYKQQLLPAALVFAAFFILFRIALPQLSEISAVNQQIDKKEQNIADLQNSLTLLQTIPINTIDRDFEVATTALPAEKNVALMFTMLNSAANKADVSLQGFSLKVGDIFDTKKELTGEKSIDGLPYLSVTIQAEGNNSDLKNFAENLYQSLPLVELTRVSIDKGLGSYDVNFFFKPYDVLPTALLNNVESLTPREANLLKQLDAWFPQ